MRRRSILFILLLNCCIVLPLPAAITVVNDIPDMTIVENRNDGLDNSSTIVGDPSAATYFVKGQTFTLSGTEEIRNVYVRMDDNAASVDDVGSLTIEFFNSVAGEPTAPPNSGGAIYAQSDAFPSGAGLGEYLEINLDSPVNLAAGEYAFALSTSDLNLNLDVQGGGGRYPGGSLVRHNGTAWQIRTNDFIFGLAGASPDPLKIVVDRATGGVTMENANTLGIAYDLDYYEIKSVAGSLSESGWTSLADQNLPGFPSGDGSGNGWEEGGNNNANQLIESFLLGSSTMTDGQSLSLGGAFVPGGTEDLMFLYHQPGATVATVGMVEYEGTSVVNGDFDGNSLYECADVDALVAEIVAGTNNPMFDLTADGAVDINDLDAWRAEAGAGDHAPPLTASGNPVQEGDANLDGTVDVSDFNLWNGSKFTSIARWCNGDFNADGVVDVSDFNLWNGNKFQSADAVSAVPEPAGLGWAVVGAIMGLLRVARRRGGV